MYKLRCSKYFMAAAVLLVKSVLAQDPQEPREQRTATRVTVAAGTKIVLVLKSGLHSSSAIPGAGVYLETLFPVVQDSRVVIPERTQVQGVVAHNDMPGRIRRGAQLRVQFTTMIFPDSTVRPIEGVLFSVPGAEGVQVRGDDGSLETIDQTGKVIAPLLTGAAGAALAGAALGGVKGAARGAGVGAGISIMNGQGRRGDDIDLPRGTEVEIVLKAPLDLEPDLAERNSRYIAPPVAEPITPVRPVQRQAGGKRPLEAPGMVPIWMLFGLGGLR